jgi:hypothetical protein
MVKRKLEAGKTEKIPVITYRDNSKWGLKESIFFNLTESQISDKNADFNPADVTSKLTASSKEDNDEKDRAALFGIEDEDGNVVKVWIKQEQADDFEHTIRELVNDEDYDSKNVEEILFDLRQQFDIVSAEFPKVQEDEEPEAPKVAQGDQQPLADGQAPGPTDTPPVDGQPPVDQAPPMDMPPPDDTSTLTGDEDSAKSALDKVIDLLKSEVDARKADSEARGKEAEARALEAKNALSKLKLQDIEKDVQVDAWQKQRSDNQKESKRLTQRAQFNFEQNR